MEKVTFKAFLRSDSAKKVMARIVFKPFLVSLIPLFFVIIAFVLVKLNIILEKNLFADILLAGDVVGVLLVAPIFVLFLELLTFIMLVKNFEGKDFSSFRIDRFGKPCDFYHFVYGKRLGTISMESNPFKEFWMPLAGSQICTLVLLLFVASFVVSVSL